MDNNSTLRSGGQRGSVGGGTGVLVAVILVVGLLITGVLAVLLAGANSSSSNQKPSNTEWTAVFMKDSEVFFGHLKSQTKDEIVLVKVFYLKTDKNSATSTGAQTNNNGLTVLGLVANQLQCPTDEIHLKLHNVLNVQVLRSDSYVVKNLDVVSKQPQSCFQPPASASPTPTAVATAIPTATPAPTKTPAATATSAASPSGTASPAAN